MENCVNQIIEGNQSIVGLMLESHLNWGRQEMPQDLRRLQYGVSITDACIDWKSTESLVMRTAAKLAKVLPDRFTSGT